MGELEIPLKYVLLQGYKLLRAKILRSVAGCHFALGRYHEAAEEYDQSIEVLNPKP